MPQKVEDFIKYLKELDIEEKKIKETRNHLLDQLKRYDEELEQISLKRSLVLRELEVSNSSDQSESEFQSFCSDNSLYPKSSDIDSDEFSQKRKKRCDSTESDVEAKKARNNGNNLMVRPNTVEEVNSLDQNMVDKCIDEMANNVIREISGSDLKLKGELEKLSHEPDFESLVKDVENDIKCEDILKVDSLTQTSPSLLSLYRSNSTDGNFKENISPSSKVRRTSSNRFKFDQQNLKCKLLSPIKSNSSVDSTPALEPSKVLKGNKFLSELLSNKKSIDKQRDKEFSQKVEITPKGFKENMLLWERRANEDNAIQKHKTKKINVQIKDIIDSI